MLWSSLFAVNFSVLISTSAETNMVSSATALWTRKSHGQLYHSHMDLEQPWSAPS